MSVFHVLVKDFGREGLTVCGLTNKDVVAQAWESGDVSNRRIEIDSEASLSPGGYDLSEKI